MGSAKKRVQVAKEKLEELEKIFEDLYAEAKEAAKALKDAEKLAGETSKTGEWMFADAGSMIPLGTFFARFNPTRWSGEQTYAKMIEYMQELIRKEEGGRPITIK